MDILDYATLCKKLHVSYENGAALEVGDAYINWLRIMNICYSILYSVNDRLRTVYCYIQSDALFMLMTLGVLYNQFSIANHLM